MLSFGNKEFRNLEEQVQKNKADIEDWKSKQETLANWGIRIVGQIESESDLPEDYSGEYGDAYQVGTGDSAKYFAWIRPTTEVAKDHWMDMGSLSIAGPQGPAGDEIESINFVSSESKVVPDGNKQTDNTIRVTMSDGRTIDFTVKAYADKGDKGDQGIQGIQGIQGPKGDKGDKGDVGPQGEMGPTAPAYHIIGIVTSTSQLPDPEVLKDLSGAYIVEESGVNNLYIQMGKTLEEAKWTLLGELSATNYWEVSGTTLAPVEAVDLVQINNLDVLNSFSCKNPSITGTISGSAILSPANLSLAGTTGVDIINNGKTAISIDKDNWVHWYCFDNSGANQDRYLLSLNPNTFEVVKNANITANGKTGELKATKVTAPTISGTNITATTFTGALNGNATTATTATKTSQLLHCGSTRYTSGDCLPSTIGCQVLGTLCFSGAMKPSTSDAPVMPGGPATDFTLTTQNWDNEKWGTQIAYMQADYDINQSGLAVRSLGQTGTALFTDKSKGGWVYLANQNTNNVFSGINKFTGSTNITTLMVNGAQVETVRRHVSEATIAGVNELLVSMQNDDITSMDIHGDFEISVGSSSGGGDSIHCYQAHVEYNGSEYLVTCIEQNGTSYMPHPGEECTISDSGDWFSVDYDLVV